MGSRGRTIWGIGLAASFMLAAPAFGAHHLVLISEVYPGATGSTDAEAVELQLLANGENQVAGQASVRIYNAAGTQTNFATFASNPPNGQSQRTMLAGTTAFQSEFGVVPDLGLPAANAMSPDGGSVCFDSTAFGFIDCVSWGVATVAPPMSSPAAPPVPAAIPDNQSLVRSLARGCATFLDSADDTNNSAADFLASAPTLRNNGTAPTETSCGGGGGGGGGGASDNNPPETTITKKPKSRTTKRRVRFEFRSSENNSRFECKLDRKPFSACSSPFRKKVKVGKHKFQVRAIDAARNADPSPATARFKRVAR